MKKRGSRFVFLFIIIIATQTTQCTPIKLVETKKTITVYLAGPDVFRPNAVEIGKRKQEICKKYGLKGLFPLDNTLNLSNLTPYEKGLKIYKANKKLMDESDAVIANMTPFRSPSTDVGTAFEMGYMAGQRKPVFAYTNNRTPYEKRIAECCKKISKTKDRYEDENHNELELFTMTDNLMLDGAVTTSTNGLVTHATQKIDCYDDLSTFEACVKTVADFFNKQ